jgi:23S rRNA (uracil1939-C5)-methyltransferase
VSGDPGAPDTPDARLLTLRVERLAAGGEGVARDDAGRVVFVPGTAPGDRVRAAVVVARRRFARARVVERLASGPDRVTPTCPVFGECGGCTWQHLAYPAQLAAKGAILRDAWTRVGRLPDPGPVRVEASPAPYGWRARARVAVEGGRVGYRRAGSRALCATARCPILVPSLEARLAELAADPPADGEVVLAAGDAPAPGEGAGVGLRAGPDVLHVSPESFFQAHEALRGRLAEAVWEAAGRGRRALELFAGVGFFTLGLARRFDATVAVEGEPAASADLHGNVARAGLGAVRVVEASVERALAAGVLRPAPDVVVLDPPRSGLSPASRRALAGLPDARLVYVSCDPATLARDAAALVTGGRRLCSLRAFDLFPQTSHVEALAVFEPEPGGGRGAG